MSVEASHLLTQPCRKRQRHRHARGKPERAPLLALAGQLIQTNIVQDENAPRNRIRLNSLHAFELRKRLA